MNCADIEDLIEDIASGGIAPGRVGAGVSAHLASCASCARALETARRLDTLLRARPAPQAPSQFTMRVVNRIHRATWRREQIVDGIFNSAMIAAALLVAVGLWIALRRTGVASFFSQSAMSALNSEMLAAAQKVAPSLPLYAGATGLIVVALGVWWWASDSAAL